MTQDSNRVRFSEEVKAILTRIKARIWTRPDTLCKNDLLHLIHNWNYHTETYNTSSRCIVTSNLLKTQKGNCIGSLSWLFQSILNAIVSFTRMLIWEFKDAVEKWEEIFWVERFPEDWRYLQKSILVRNIQSPASDSCSTQVKRRIGRRASDHSVRLPMPLNFWGVLKRNIHLWRRFF